MRRLYSLILILGTPLVLLYFGIRGFRDHRYWHRWSERLGWSRRGHRPCDVLVHAASLGEVNAASPLISALLARSDIGTVLVTGITPTGSHRINELFGDQVAHCYLPMDLPGATKRFLGRVKPRVIVVIETEIWPNLYHAASQQKTPLIIANARLSRESLRGYRRWKSLIAPALASTHQILAQTRRDARRFIQSGAPSERLSVTGNLKFDVTVSVTLLETGELLRTAWGVQRPVLVAGSTHEADEAVLFPAFKKLLRRHPAALLVVAPRHPERFTRTAQDARQAGLKVALRSEVTVPSADTECLVIDTMGELLNYYATADIAFVGGTIADVGGHNLLEPSALGRPLLFGPHTDHVKATATRLLESGAARRVLTVNDVLEISNQLFSQPATRDRMGQAGLKLVTEGRGALERTLAVIDFALEKKPRQ